MNFKKKWQKLEYWKRGLYIGGLIGFFLGLIFNIRALLGALTIKYAYITEVKIVTWIFYDFLKCRGDYCLIFFIVIPVMFLVFITFLGGAIGYLLTKLRIGK